MTAPRPAFIFIFTVVTALCTVGCGESFTGDIVDPRLPEYSESGRNHAGAYVNGLPWRAYPRYSFKGGEDPAYLRFDSVADTYNLIFPAGNYITPAGTHGARVNMRFVISAEALAPIIEGTAELPFVINLDGERAHAELYFGATYAPSDSSETCVSLHGLLHLRRVASLGSEFERRTLIAGTFGFDTEDACGVYQVRSGRFDFSFRCAGAGCF